MFVFVFPMLEPATSKGEPYINTYTSLCLLLAVPGLNLIILTSHTEQPVTSLVKLVHKQAGISVEAHILESTETWLTSMK